MLGHQLYSRCAVQHLQQLNLHCCHYSLGMACNNHTHIQPALHHTLRSTSTCTGLALLQVLSTVVLAIPFSIPTHAATPCSLLCTAGMGPSVSSLLSPYTCTNSACYIVCTDMGWYCVWSHKGKQPDVAIIAAAEFLKEFLSLSCVVAAASPIQSIH